MELPERIYRLFAIRPRSEKEIRDYLKRISFKRKIKGEEELSQFIIDTTVELMKQKGVIDDEKFARAWAESRRRAKLKGKVAVKAELFQKGINRETVEEVISAQVAGYSEEELAKQALERKAKRWENLDNMEFRKKALEFLMRGGFEYGLAKEVVEKVVKKV